MTLITDVLVPELREAREAEAAVADRFRAHGAAMPAGEQHKVLKRHANDARSDVRDIDRRLGELQSRGRVQGVLGNAWHITERAARLPFDAAMAVPGVLLRNHAEVTAKQRLKNAKDEYAVTAYAVAACRAGERMAAEVGDGASAQLFSSIRERDEELLEELSSSLERQADAVVAEAAENGSSEGAQVADAAVAGGDAGPIGEAEELEGEELTGSGEAREEELAGLDAELQAREQQLASLTEQLKAREEELTGLDAELQAREEQLTTLDEELRARELDLRLQAGELEAREEELQVREEGLDARDEDLQLREEAVQQGAEEQPAHHGNGETAWRVPGVSRVLSALKGGAAEEEEPPIQGYEELNVTEVTSRLPRLSQADLVAVGDYERSHADRSGVLNRIAGLQRPEPWPGYDGMTAAEIRMQLRGADPGFAEQALEYERRHRARSTVITAAQRARA